MTQAILPQTPGLYVQDQAIAFPLKHTDVKARISGNLSRVNVTHRFENPFTTALEATYVFPLPDQAAVDTMTIRLGERTIQGRIEKREKAQTIYEQAKQKGQTAGLLEQERANIFTQSLANILPGEQIEVTLTYSDQLPYKQGAYEFVFPMVVGPRYIPGNPIAETGSPYGSATEPMTLNQDTDLVPDASRLNGPIMPAGVRAGHDIQVTVEIDTGAGISPTKLQSPSHQIEIDREDSLTRITLAPSDTIPNKDLILRYQVAGDHTQTSLLTQADERGGHFAIYMVPAVSYDTNAYIPKEMVFLIDTSGSQSGAPLAQCQALMRRFIEGLHPQDTFNIVNFANTTQQLASVSLDNTPNHRKQALNYVNRLRAAGGTEMLRGFKTVLNLPQLDQERIRNIVLLTDGYIGNETQIFATAQRSLSPSARLHSFGAGSSVNRFLLNRVAELGRGISHVVRHDEAIDQVVTKFFEQINNPVLANLSLHWEGSGKAPSFYPMAIPDLFAEQPLVLFGRKHDQRPGTLQIKGIEAGGKTFEQSFAVNFEASGNPAIAQLWGRARIKELMNQMVSGETTRGVDAVTETALDYQLLSQYTAFVAVSDDVRVEQPDKSVSVNVPVLLPDAISHENVFYTSAAAPIRARRAKPMAPKSAAPRLGGLLKRKAKFEEGQTPMSADAIASVGPTNTFEDMTEEFDSLASPTSDFEEFDSLASTLDEDAFDQPSEPVAASAQAPQSPQQIYILEAKGLKNEVREQLEQHLQSLQLVDPQTGTLVFKLVIQTGRVKRVMLDEDASDPQTPDVVEQIRRALIAWHCSQTLTAPLKVEMLVQI